MPMSGTAHVGKPECPVEAWMNRVAVLTPVSQESRMA